MPTQGKKDAPKRSITLRPQHDSACLHDLPQHLQVLSTLVERPVQPHGYLHTESREYKSPTHFIHFGMLDLAHDAIALFRLGDGVTLVPRCAATNRAAAEPRLIC